MGWFGKKKEEKKKFDYSEETKELFAERDAYYAEQRRKLGGGSSNPELAKQKEEVETPSRKEDLEDLLGGSGDFNPYVNKDESAAAAPANIPSSQPSSASSSAYSCSSCGKEFQEKWGKCPSCGGEMKKANSPAPPESIQEPSMPASSNSTVGDPLDDLLGDFGSSNDSSEDDSSEESNNVRMVSDDDSGSSTGFGSPTSSHSNRKKVRKVRKVKRPRKK